MKFKNKGLCFFAGLFILFFAQTTHAQEPGICEMDFSSKADKLYEKGLSELKVNHPKAATNLFLEALGKDENHVHARYFLGYISFHEGKYTAAEKHFNLVMEWCDDYNGEIHRMLGIIAVTQSNYAAAADHFDRALKLGLDEFLNEESTRSMRDDCRILADLKANPVAYNPKPLRGVSTTEDEYLAIISPDGSLCFYTKRYYKKERNMLTGQNVEEFFQSFHRNGEWMAGEAMSYPFNQNLNEGGPTVTANNHELFFTICQPNEATGKINCDIWYTVQQGEFWGDIQPLSDVVNHPEAWDSQPSISADGKVLYFTSSRKGGEGGLDIWRSKRQGDGTWSEPENLGPTVNTEGDEKSPFIHSDSRTLYFSSSGQLGFGGYDLFFVKETDEGWGEVKNLGYPINTQKDEVGMFVSLDGTRAYFSSNEVRGMGGWDVFYFELPEKAKPEKVSLVTGTLVDDDGQPVTDARVEVKNLKTKEIDIYDVDEYTGDYAVIVDKSQDDDHFITVKKEGHTFASQYVAADDTASVVEADLQVKPIEVGVEAPLNNIQFATNSYSLTSQGKVVVEEFAAFMRENPSLVVSIEGHTDNVGDPGENLTLSKQRAEAVYQYLIDLGISSRRLSHKGFGQSQPIADNSTARGRAQNRRTVFRVVRK